MILKIMFFVVVYADTYVDDVEVCVGDSVSAPILRHRL
jgi:hypothetical protein